MAFASRFIAAADAVAAFDVDDVRRSDCDASKAGCRRPTTDEFGTFKVAAWKD